MPEYSTSVARESGDEGIPGEFIDGSPAAVSSYVAHARHSQSPKGTLSFGDTRWRTVPSLGVSIDGICTKVWTLFGPYASGRWRTQGNGPKRRISDLVARGTQ